MTAMSAARVAEALARRKVRAQGGNYLVPCPAHEGRTPSLSLKDGEAGLLLVHCFAGCDPTDVLAAIRDQVGAPELHAQPQRPLMKGSDEYERQQHDKAAWLWGRRRPIEGSIAARYLRVRGYPAELPLPVTLALLPPSRPEHHPALIAAFGLCDEPEPARIAAPRQVNAVHLVLLKPDGSGKADTKPDKLTIGRPLGRPIVIAPANDLLGLAICEGIEDALSIYAGTGLGVWASASAPFLPALADAVPAYVECVTICAHPDQAGEINARQLAAALRKRSIETILEGLS
jgi:hypothetical protein